MCARQVGPEELLSDAAFLRLLDTVDSDAEDAVEQAAKLLSKPPVKAFSSSWIANYKAVAAQLKQARADLQKAVILKLDAKRFAVIWNKYRLSLEALQQENFYFTAVNAEDLQTICVALLACGERLEIEHDSRTICQAFKNLQILNEDIQNAIKELRNTTILRQLHLALTAAAKAVELALAPEAPIGEALLGAIELVGDLTLDKLLSPKGVTLSSAAADSVGALGTTLGLMKKVEAATAEAGKKITGAFTILSTLNDDSKEVAEAEDTLNELQQKYTAARQALEVMLTTMVPLSRKMDGLASTLRDGAKAIALAEKQKESASKNYDKINAKLRSL